ncbi:hypothetical protein C8R44DRAFT_754222 [Mycena epipterygia]|nr:hypothetical protein C8R44DRAFT_754222 [Mycena epipterygia]
MKREQKTHTLRKKLSSPKLPDRESHHQLWHNNGDEHHLEPSPEKRQPASFGWRHIWVHRNPSACEDGGKTPPDDVEQLTAAVDIVASVDWCSGGQGILLRKAGIPREEREDTGGSRREWKRYGSLTAASAPFAIRPKKWGLLDHGRTQFGPGIVAPGRRSRLGTLDGGCGPCGEF